MSFGADKSGGNWARSMLQVKDGFMCVVCHNYWHICAMLNIFTKQRIERCAYVSHLHLLRLLLVPSVNFHCQFMYPFKFIGKHTGVERCHGHGIFIGMGREFKGSTPQFPISLPFYVHWLCRPGKSRAERCRTAGAYRVIRWRWDADDEEGVDLVAAEGWAHYQSCLIIRGRSGPVHLARRTWTFWPNASSVKNVIGCRRGLL